MHLLAKKTLSVLAKKHTKSSQSSLKQAPFQVDGETGLLPTVGELIIKFRAWDWVGCVVSNFVHFPATVFDAEIYSLSLSKAQKEWGNSPMPQIR